MPHAGGAIHTVYDFGTAGWNATVTLPPGLDGELIWGAHRYPLQSGTQVVHLSDHGG